MSKIRVALVLAGLVVNHGLRAQFNFMGFEGGYVTNIPYATNVGIPNGTTANQPFNYTFAQGNNIQSFQNPSLGIVDTDDVYTGSSSTLAVPDYYKSPDFGWKMVGWKAASNSSVDWSSSNYLTTFIGNGEIFDKNGEDYPGSSGGRNVEISEEFNINYKFSTTGNLYHAPGLGDYFLDVHGRHWTNSSSTAFSSHFVVDFEITASSSYFMTLGFGGRDKGSVSGQSLYDSEATKAYYRVISTSGPTTGTVIFSGDTGQTPFEAWKPDPAFPTDREKVVASTLTNNNGVTFKEWEYFKPTFNGVAGQKYRLEIMMPDELNFDMVLGSNYNNVVDFVDLVPVPEPATYGLFGALGLGGLILVKRRKARVAGKSR